MLLFLIDQRLINLTKIVIPQFAEHAAASEFFEGRHWSAFSACTQPYNDHVHHE